MFQPEEEEEDRILTVEEVAGPCQNVVPDLLIDAKYNVLGFDMEKVR